MNRESYKILMAVVSILSCLLASCQKDKEGLPSLQIRTLNPSQGPKMAEVTLTGSGFSANASDNKITLNDHPCPIIASTPNRLTFTIPLRAGSGNIMLQVNGQAKQGPYFTYQATQTIQDFVGSEQGYQDGIMREAKFNYPIGVAVAANGTIYIADRDNHRIRKVTPQRVVQTLAGGEQGYQDGLGTAAQFSIPMGIAIADNGTLYITDGGNYKIRKVTPDGVVTTVAGSVRGYQDGVGSAAQFQMLTGITVATGETLYVTDYHKIRKITPAGEVSTLAGDEAGYQDGIAPQAKFNAPAGITAAKDGTLYIVDTYNHRIRKITPAGVVTTLAGSNPGFADGEANRALFNAPFGIALASDGSVYVTDLFYQYVRRISPAGQVSTLLNGLYTTFNSPTGIAVSNDGAIVITEDSHQIRKIVEE